NAPFDEVLARNANELASHQQLEPTIPIPAPLAGVHLAQCLQHTMSNSTMGREGETFEVLYLRAHRSLRLFQQPLRPLADRRIFDRQSFPRPPNCVAAIGADIDAGCDLVGRGAQSWRVLEQQVQPALG